MYIYICDWSVDNCEQSCMILFSFAHPAAHGSRAHTGSRPSWRPASSWRNKLCRCDWALGNINAETINPFNNYTVRKEVNLIHRLSAVRSTLGVRWSHGNLQSLRHPGLPALLQVIGLGVNGGGLTTRRCRRRTSRAATTQASPSERMLLRPRQSMTRLDPKRAAAAARCLTVQLEV